MQAVMLYRVGTWRLATSDGKQTKITTPGDPFVAADAVLRERGLDRKQEWYSRIPGEWSTDL